MIAVSYFYFCILGNRRNGSTSIFLTADALSSLKISQAVTTRRLLCAIALCRVFLNYADTERYANEIIAYYATIGETVGAGYKDCSLDYLADFWLDESSRRRAFTARSRRHSWRLTNIRDRSQATSGRPPACCLGRAWQGSQMQKSVRRWRSDKLQCYMPYRASQRRFSSLARSPSRRSPTCHSGE